MDFFNTSAYLLGSTGVLASEITDTVVDAGSTATTLEDYINVVFFSDLCGSFAHTFVIGFAFTTLLVLLTYGVFKAFSLVRIE